MLRKKKTDGAQGASAARGGDFDYLSADDVYLDAACQSLRPRPVMAAMQKYFQEYNSCGGRGKYPWGSRVEEEIQEVRKKILRLLKLSGREYFVSFTLNTTYGVNLLLNSIKPELIDIIYTSEVEHNSPLLATMKLAERLGVPRVVLKREENGEIDLGQVEQGGFRKSVVVVNVATNFDGRALGNVKELVRRVHAEGGIVILDAAQAMAHQRGMLEKTEADAVVASGHKMYGPSIGVMVVRRDLVGKLSPAWVGGGMVDDVFQDRYILSSGRPEVLFEPGLQPVAEILGLGAAVDWLEARSREDTERLWGYARELDEFLRGKPKVKLVNRAEDGVNPTMSFCVEGVDAHLLGEALGREGVMARTGYFCVHYYLDKVCGWPPLVRFALSYATRAEDIERVKAALRKL